MVKCLQSKLKTAEGKIDKATKTLSARYNEEDLYYIEAGRRDKDEPGYLATFEKAQTSWKNFRDAECDYLNFESIDGTGYGTILLGCIVDQTELRAEHLSKFVDMP